MGEHLKLDMGPAAWSFETIGPNRVLVRHVNVEAVFECFRPRLRATDDPRSGVLHALPSCERCDQQVDYGSLAYRELRGPEVTTKRRFRRGVVICAVCTSPLERLKAAAQQHGPLSGSEGFCALLGVELSDAERRQLRAAKETP